MTTDDERQPATTGGFARLTRQSIVYAVGSVAGKAVGLVMLPILTRLLTPADYGRLDVLSTMASALISAMLLGLDAATVRLASERIESSERARLYGSWIVLAAVLAGTPAVFLLALRTEVSEVLLGTAAYGDAVGMAAIVLVSGTFYVIGLTLLRTQHRAGAYALVSATSLGINAALAIAFLVFWQATTTAVLLALAIAWAVGAGIALTAGRPIGRPDRRAASRLLRLGIPLAPAAVALWFGEFANRAILLGIAGPEQVAFLSVALRFASIAGLAVVGYQLAWQPRAYAAGLGPEALALIGIEGRQILVLVCVVIAAVASGAPELVAVASGDRWSIAVPAIGFALVAQLGAAVLLVASMPSSLGKSMGSLGLAGVLSVVATVVGTAVLGASLGAVGAAAAIAAGQALAAFVAWELGRRKVTIPLDWRRVAPLLASCSVVAVASTMLLTETPLMRAALFTAFLLLLLAEGTLREIVGQLAPRLRKDP